MLKKKIQGKEILRAWPHLLFETYLAHIDSVKLPLLSCNIEIRICSTELTKTDETTFWEPTSYTFVTNCFHLSIETHASLIIPIKILHIDVKTK